LEYVANSKGDLLVDFLGRFENLGSDLLKVYDELGIELKTIPHENRSVRGHYSSFYTPKTKMIVEERFKRDIEYFGYEFEGAKHRT
jgi:hypothetical protein